jgi:hypothetical protein
MPHTSSFIPSLPPLTGGGEVPSPLVGEGQDGEMAGCGPDRGRESAWVRFRQTPL